MAVSMKSGLEDRNNSQSQRSRAKALLVSMKSGLEDRNNCSHGSVTPCQS